MNRNIRTFWLSIFSLLLAVVSYLFYFVFDYIAITNLPREHVFLASLFGSSFSGILAAWLFTSGRTGMKVTEKILLIGVWGLALFPYACISYHHSREYFREKSEQQSRSTMATIIAVASAWEEYSSDHGSFCLPEMKGNTFAWGNVSPDRLDEALAPYREKYLAKGYSLVDAWKRPLQFCVGSWDYAIRSSGMDGKWDAERYLLIRRRYS